MLNTVVLSDLHFGEPYGLLHDQGVPPLLNLIKAHARGRLRRLVLAGDIFEMSTPESLEAVRTQARFFFQQARSRFQIDELVWVPGNHDYSLFRRLVPQLAATDWRGDPAPREFIEELIGPWSGSVRIAYPHLQLHAKRAAATWIIHHGHYFDDLVLGRTRNDRVRAGFAALGAGNLLVSREVPIDQPLLLAQVEEIVRPVIEKIWRHHPDPNNVQNELWDLLRRWNDYAACVCDTPELTVRDPQEATLLDRTLDKVRFYIGAVRRDPAYPGRAAPGERITLVWGHTHDGGVWRGNCDGVPVRQVNLGGWIPDQRPTRRGDAAHTHLYMLNDDLEERLLAVPFPAEWVNRCIDHGRSVFAIPGVDDDLISRERAAPPAAGMDVSELLGWHRQRPFGGTRAQDDPFA